MACLAQAKEFGGSNGRCTLIDGGNADVVYAASYNTALVRTSTLWTVISPEPSSATHRTTWAPYLPGPLKQIDAGLLNVGYAEVGPADGAALASINFAAHALTLPFLYTYPGFECEEIEHWHENGEDWRRLKVTFPDPSSPTDRPPSGGPGVKLVQGWPRR
jgi:hypothetical protein